MEQGKVEKMYVSKVMVFDVNRKDRAILVTVYNTGKFERSIAKIENVNEMFDIISKDVNRVVFVQGKGEKFIFPDTRLELHDEDFWKCRLNGYIMPRVSEARYKLMKVLRMGEGSKYVCSVSRI